MSRRRVLASVLHNFLGTFTSRNSDYGGYWAFGFLRGFVSIEMDLLTDVSNSSDTPLRFVRSLAVVRFHEQLSKSALEPAFVQSARLVIERRPGNLSIKVNEHPTVGHTFRFEVSASDIHGRVSRSEATIIVARHKAAFERKSLRASVR